ncbi:MAG: hypothetical protein OK439_00635 [Thaumarchaeota archaeon]|nr:hypothetical protein [Nitrososphaerota archaeon]
MEETSKSRLVDTFGETAARIIIDHEKDLQETFGRASSIIKRVIDGDFENGRRE